jgi:quercetin dioxygenase-like cupin family protein
MALFLPPPAAAQSGGAAPQSSRKTLMAKDLPDFPGKEAMVYIVEYPPGTNNVPHRHNGHVFLHVLEGQLNAQVKGGELTVLNPGSTYYESPSDIHVVSRNPSSTVPAKAIIFIIHDKGAALSTPVKE